MIRITAKQPQGRWRCGVFHPPTAIDHADGRFSKDQLAQLQADPMLSVELLKGAPEHPAPASAEAAGERKALAEIEAGLARREDSLAERARALDEREKELGEREAGLAELQSDERFRHIVLLFAVHAVIEGNKSGDLTKDGAPTTQAIQREARGWYTVSAEERDKLFAEAYPEGVD